MALRFGSGGVVGVEDHDAALASVISVAEGEVRGDLVHAPVGGGRHHLFLGGQSLILIILSHNGNE